MKLALDLDGVTYNWQRTAAYMLREYRGAKIPPVEEFWFHWDAIKDYCGPGDWKWLWSEGVELGLFRYGHMTTGARIGLQKLHSQGHKIEIVTHRPANAVSDTLDWVSLYFKDIPLNGFHILTNGEPKTVSKADILIDDKPENVQAWADTGREAILYDRPWNFHYMPGARVNLVKNWKAVVSRVKSLSS
jgi:5'(3')-deoxyribonucleotidase